MYNPGTMPFVSFSIWIGFACATLVSLVLAMFPHWDLVDPGLLRYWASLVAVYWVSTVVSLGLLRHAWAHWGTHATKLLVRGNPIHAMGGGYYGRQSSRGEIVLRVLFTMTPVVNTFFVVLPFMYLMIQGCSGWASAVASWWNTPVTLSEKR